MRNNKRNSKINQSNSFYIEVCMRLKKVIELKTKLLNKFEILNKKGKYVTD
jgi:hypothetical protein